MRKEQYWLSDAGWKRIEPLLDRYSYALTGSTGQIGPSPSTLPTSKPTGRRRMKKGNFQQTAGRSRGGRTTKIHALTEDRGPRSRS